MQENTWEQETIELLQWVQEEQRKAENRLASAQRSVEQWKSKLAVVQQALDVYRDRYGVVPTEAPFELDLVLLKELPGLAPKEMMEYWADKHGGCLIMNDLVKVSVKVGAFRDKPQARGTLYSTIKRMQAFKRETPGVYQRGSNGTKLNDSQLKQELTHQEYSNTLMPVTKTISSN